MNPLVWWAIPIAATALALAWAAWASRSRPRADAYNTVDDYRKFRDALQDAAARDVRQLGRKQPSPRVAEAAGPPRPTQSNVTSSAPAAAPPPPPPPTLTTPALDTDSSDTDTSDTDTSEPDERP